MNFVENNLWGIDLGGTKIEGAVLRSPENPEMLFRERVPTEANKGYAHILAQIVKLVDSMIKKMGYKPSHIGFATPGTLDPQLGTMKNCNTTVMNGMPMKDDLERFLNVSVSIANDANCFALAETRLGIVKKKFPHARVVFGVIMGTGVGGGLVINNQVINGLHGISGEWGHNFLHESGGPCYCGKSGCVEKVLSGPALEQFYFKESGVKRSLKEITALVASGKDTAAQKTMLRLTDFFGVAISVLVNILDPDVIVIGGGVGNVEEIYSRGMESLRKNIFNNRLETPIVRPLLGDSAGVFGAAFLADQQA